MIRKAYKFKLKTNVEIEQKLNTFCGHSRFVWNQILHRCLQRLNNKQSIIWYHEADWIVKFWKKTNEFGFIKECHSQVLQQKLKDLDKAFRDGFDKNHQGKRLPRFKKKNLNDSIRYVQGFKIDNKRLYLPKIGWVGFFKSQDIKGVPKNITISKYANNWYISIQVEIEKQIQSNAVSEIAIDLGVTNFATLSDGKIIQPINSYKLQKNKLAKLQRQLAKKKKFSNNWSKHKLKISKLHQKISNTRKDFLHKTSTNLSKNHAIVYVEDLKVKNMSKSAKGDAQCHGKNVKSKSGLNRSILDQSWREFTRQLEYKLNWNKGSLIRVNPKYTSQKCHKCGYTNKLNRRTQSEFVCLHCGLIENADINAARNILALGQSVLACGEKTLDFSMKQEPQGKSNLVPALV